MKVGHTINQLRLNANLTQAKFAEMLGVSQQSVQKWESGVSTPDMDKFIKMSKYFDVSLDELIMGNDSRVVEEMNKENLIKPQYQNFDDYEFYGTNLMIEYKQCMEEGLDVERYKDLFNAVYMLPQNEIKKKLSDLIFEIVSSAKPKAGYPYTEPSDLESIKSLRKNPLGVLPYDKATLKDKIHGAWLGRICGCLLGRPVEGIRTNELIPFLKETGNYPMHRHILRSDLNDEIVGKYKFGFARKSYADEIDGMYVDDDTNYMVLAQEIIQNYGKDFTPFDVSRAWLHYQSKDRYCTAERVAYCNFIKGYVPPQSALYQNAAREWIGAQIRGDYFGYINPGNPALAAEMAWRDACISHVKNGIYGEMFISAMIAIAASTSDVEQIILGGLAEIPATSRLYEKVMALLDAYRAGVTQQQCFEKIHSEYDEHDRHDWCHTISNALIVVASLLYGGGDYGKSICMAVETGFDTDCNGATVGSILGMANGVQSIPSKFSDPVNNTLYTGIFGFDKVKISDRVNLTMQHVEK